jgi:hypothetical protein
MPLSKTKPEPQVIGWREWIRLPDFGPSTIKAKVDTGARTSSLHAFEVEEFRRGKRDMVRFQIHPEQRSSKVSIEVEAPLLERRKVTPSSGHSELRPVVLTTIELMGESFEVELTLTRRDEMGFRMLLGRQALRGRFLVNPGKSYMNGVRKKKRSIKKKGRPR